ncbi:tetratricopeptide repeat protein [Streptomyces sp. FIT100]|uniref:tetratricopeptide repeat protein n=1 Tax=Streptomyces sp. FIT100 TaxID=2837956 RepID=UPI0021C91E99|nr:tetratricopeptide repeat protein [Streptomyces sp. FIT100]UUN27485.1 sel1 repeat family protein [Streptomyces sp. FIT100]
MSHAPLVPPSDAPAPRPVPELLAEARRAATDCDWITAGHAWVEAAMQADLEGANQAAHVAAPELKVLADAGSAAAAALLSGILLEYYEESALPMAVEYAKAAADAVHPAGQRTYGHMLATGQGVEEDEERAAELFRAAADAGDAYGMFNLAVTLDGDEELRLLAGAAARGISEAGCLLGDRLGAVDRDEEALAWYLWAAERGETKAMYAAACWYRDGFGTDPDPVQAVRWYFTMFEHGDGDGIHDAIELAKQGMTDEQIHEAGRLAGQPGSAQALIGTVTGKRPQDRV